MKYTVSLIVALLGALVSVSDAQEQQAKVMAPTPKLTGSFTTVFSTAYIGKIGSVFYRKPVSFNYLDLNFGDDWTAEIWSATGLGGEKYGTTYGDEFDLFLTWHHQFNDVRVSLTGAYSFIKDLGMTMDDIWIAEGEVSYAKYAYFQPYVSVRYFGQVTSKSPESGWFGWVGVRGCYPTPIKQMKLTLDLSAAYSDGAFGETPGAVFGRAIVGLPIQVSKRVTLTPSVLFQTPIGQQREHAIRYTDRNEAVGSLALSISF